MSNKSTPKKRPRTALCSQCGGEGHISQECPNAHDGIIDEQSRPTALFGSIVESSMMTPNVVIATLEKVHTNTQGAVDEEMGANTRRVIDHTIPLVKAGSARGKQQALVVFALLINGADHRDMMKSLREAVVPLSSEVPLPPEVAAFQFKAFLATFASLDSKADGFIEQASRASKENYYDVVGLERTMLKECVNVLQYLEDRNLLTESTLFKGRKIWHPKEKANLFERHIQVQLMTEDKAMEDARSIMNNRTALLYGESGSGKTSTAVLSCKEGDLCIFLTPYLFAEEGTAMTDFTAQLKLDQKRFSEQFAQENLGKAHCEQIVPKLSGSICIALEELIRSKIRNCQSLVEFTGNVVLVVDEVGSHPDLVRALCRERSSIVTLLKGLLKVAGKVGLVVCGTGCETGVGSLGSYPSTFEALRCEAEPFQKHVIGEMAKKGFVALSELLSGKEPSSASYYHKMSIGSASVAYVQRLMLNRRYSAVLLLELAQSFKLEAHCDKKIPWLTVLPVFASSALVKFKGLNGLQSRSWDETLFLFARALAYCFGGSEQAIEESIDLQSVYGMITDNARLCTLKECDVRISDHDSGKHLALPKKGIAHCGRRVQMSPAMTEMGLQRFSLSTVARARTDAAFETTLMDWMYCWCLACCADVSTITLLGEKSGTIHAVPLAQDVDEEDAEARQALLTVMMKMRDTLKALQQKSGAAELQQTCGAVVLRVCLLRQVESVADAEKVAFAEAWALIGEADVPFVLVALNAPKASFADLFVVAGRTSDPKISATTVPALFVAIQAKHFLKSQLNEVKATNEHSKQSASGTRQDGKRSNLFVSLVLVAHPQDGGEFDENTRVANASKVVDVASGTTTVRIRCGALASVMHPITLGADPKQDVSSSDAEKCNLRHAT